MPGQHQAAIGLHTLTPVTNNGSSPPGTLPSPRSTMKRTYEDMKNGAIGPHVPGPPSQPVVGSTLTPVQTPPDPPADPRPGPGKEKGVKAVYDPTFDPTLSKKEKQNYKAKYKLFGAENEPSAPPDPRLALAGYHQGLYHTKPSKVRVREAPYVVKQYAFDPKIAIGRGPAKRVVVYNFDPFASETQIRALMGSYGSIEKLDNKTDANGSFLGVCSVWYGDTSTRSESTKAHESARRAEKEGTGQKVGLKIVRIERDPEGTRARRYSERIITARLGEQKKGDKEYHATLKRSELPKTPATPTIPGAPPPNAPRGPSGRGAGFRTDFRPPEVRPVRIPAQHVLVEKAPILPTLKRNPYIFLAHCYVPVLGTTIEHLKKRMKSYNWTDVRCDSSGYFITFPDNRRGEVECERCFRDCHLQPLFTYTMNMECQKHGNPNYRRSPSPERAAADRRVDAEKQRLRELDEADFENEKRDRARDLDLSNAALEALGPRVISMIMNDIKQKIATPSLFDSLNPDLHREKRRKFAIPEPNFRQTSFADRGIAPFPTTHEWRPAVGTSLTWHRNGKPMSRFEKQKLRREIDKASKPDSAFIDERRKKSLAARPRAGQLLHRRLQDFYESESDEETRTQLTRGSDEADSRAVSEIPQTPIRPEEGVQTPKGKRRKTDKGWAADSEDEGLDAHTKNLLGHLIGKEPEDMAMRELEQVISTLPRTSKLRKRALTEVKLRKQAEEDDALFFGTKKAQTAAPAPVADLHMEDVEHASTPELPEETVKPKKKKAAATKPTKPKKTKKQMQEEQEAARKEAEVREKLQVALEEEEAPTPSAQELVEEEEPRAEVEWSVSADRPRKTVEDDPDLVLDIDGWQHVLKDDEDLRLLQTVLQKETAANIGDIKLWAWEQKEIKALNNGGKHGVLNNAASISGYYVENMTGCARTEGVKRIAESEKSKYLPHRIRVQKQREEREAMAKKAPAAAAEAVKQAQAAKLASTSNSRQNRVNNRRLVNDIAVQKQVLGDDGVSMGFNQLKKRKKLVKFDRSAIHNWGLYADENIGAGDMIIEYVGELVRQQVANLREIKYQQQGIGSSYLFRIDDDLVVDATKKGGIARFINHSCSPSCTAKIIRVDGSKRIVIYALRDIAKNEELTYDYKFEREIGSTDRIPCLCGAIGCKGFLN